MNKRSFFCEGLLPDEKNHYHNDTSNYTVIRVLVQVPMVHEAFPLSTT